MRSRWQHGSGSGELDVFGATSYFAGGLPDRRPGEPAVAGRLIQQANNKATMHGATKMEDMISRGDPRRVVNEQLGLHGTQLVVAKPSSSGKSKLAALLSFMVSPSPRASFRKTESPPSSNKPQQLAGGDELAITKAWSSSSREMEGCGGVHELAIDLGVATGDRRLQGVRVLRGGGDDQERWVVRCSAWDEEHHESSDPKDEVEGGDDDGDHENWESDSSSDLFDLDLEYIY